MAVVGGTGAGSPAGGSNPAGVGKGLNIIGRDPMHGYAYSGAVDVENAVTVLDFSTGNYYLAGHIEFSGNWSDAGANFVLFDVKFDGQIVLEIAERRDFGAGSDQPYNILIPPYTRVECVYAGVGASTLFTTIITGRVYE